MSLTYLSSSTSWLVCNTYFRSLLSPRINTIAGFLHPSRMTAMTLNACSRETCSGAVLKPFAMPNRGTPRRGEALPRAPGCPAAAGPRPWSPPTAPPPGNLSCHLQRRENRLSDQWKGFPTPANTAITHCCCLQVKQAQGASSFLILCWFRLSATSVKSTAPKGNSV